MMDSNLQYDVSFFGSHHQLFSYGRHIGFLTHQIVRFILILVTYNNLRFAS